MNQSSLLQNSTSRTPSPFENNYESYENTRENARGERLLNEYKDTTPLVVLKQGPATNTEIAPHTDRIISRIRLSLRLLSLCVSSTIVGVLAHFMSVYLGTKGDWVHVQERYGQRRVWPQWLKMRPTFLLLGVAATATLLSLVLLVAMFSRAIRRVTVLSNFITFLICLILVPLWIAVGLYHRFDDLKGANPSDLMTYVCSKDLHPLVAQEMGNVRILCQELRYAWWAVLLVAAIELSVVATISWGIVAMKGKGKYVRVV